jgi:hypothetical protein
MKQELKMVDKRLTHQEQKKRQHLLHRYKNRIIDCPICGLKGLEKHWNMRGQPGLYISHPFSLLWLDDPTIKRRGRQNKFCKVGAVVTDTWDVPKTDEGYQIVITQLLEELEALADKWGNKSPNTRTTYTSRSRDLRSIIVSFEKYKPMSNGGIMTK